MRQQMSSAWRELLFCKEVFTTSDAVLLPVQVLQRDMGLTEDLWLYAKKKKKKGVLDFSETEITAENVICKPKNWLQRKAVFNH